MSRIPPSLPRSAALAMLTIAASCSSPTAEVAVPASTESTTTTAAAPTTTTTAAPTTTAVAPDALPLPANASELAAELADSEANVRDSSLDDNVRAQWGRRQQRLYRHLAINDRWADEVIELTPDALRTAVTLNWEARRELSSLVTSGSLSTKLPAWRIREPLPISELRALYDASETAIGIEWEYLAAINLVETRMGRIEGLSTAGATGPMQFLPSTWEECCEGDPTVDSDAILGAATYLRDRGGPTDMTKALRGYNNSGYYVRAVSAYADVLRENPEALHGYHSWEVFFRSEAGLVRIPAGYFEPEAVDAAEWIRANPENLLD